MLCSYGPKGFAVIQSTLFRIFPTHTMPDDFFNGLREQDFTNLIVIPVIVMHLISEDKDGIMLEEAWEIMARSSDFGYHVHREEDDDEELEAIIEKNIKAARKEEVCSLFMILGRRHHVFL